LHNAALSEVLSALCSMFTRSTGVRVDLSSQSDFPAISNVYEVALYRFVQEGLSNAAKHGKASSVWVNLDSAEDGISISLEDDGLGFNPGKSLPGLGLRGIRERFLALKGSLEVESALGKGTKLFGFLPVETNKT
jgi:signal transduction histidine kinase